MGLTGLKQGVSRAVFLSGSPRGESSLGVLAEF